MIQATDGVSRWSCIQSWSISQNHSEEREIFSRYSGRDSDVSVCLVCWCLDLGLRGGGGRGGMHIYSTISRVTGDHRW